MAGILYVWTHEPGLPDPVTLVGEVVARLVRPEEHPRWDTLMDAHPYLGFKQFVGRGLRYAAEWNGEWLALLGWQTGVLQCRPRNQSFCAPVHNTRLLVLPQGEGIPNLASRGLAMNLRRLSGGWQAAWAHPLELAETFVAPRLYRARRLLSGRITNRPPP